MRLLVRMISLKKYSNLLHAVSFTMAHPHQGVAGGGNVHLIEADVLRPAEGKGQKALRYLKENGI